MYLTAMYANTVRLDFKTTTTSVTERRFVKSAAQSLHICTFLNSHCGITDEPSIHVG